MLIYNFTDENLQSNNLTPIHRLIAVGHHVRRRFTYDRFSISSHERARTFFKLCDPRIGPSCEERISTL